MRHAHKLARMHTTCRPCGSAFGAARPPAAPIAFALTGHRRTLHTRVTLSTYSSLVRGSSRTAHHQINGSCTSHTPHRYHMATTTTVHPHSCCHVTSKTWTDFALRCSMRSFVTRDDVRNLAVIAHVDHGKTTLVDAMLSQSGTLANAHNRVMDSKDQERERGITILAKNTAIVLPPETEGANGTTRRINIVDTPGHLDFSGEVERALQMVEGFLLLVDAKEGVRPGTRYVLRKALSLNLRPIVCINKIDKDDRNIEKTVESVQDLFLETADDATELEMTFLYGSGRMGFMNETAQMGGTLQPLFRSIFEHVPAPRTRDAERLQMLVAQVGVDAATQLKYAICRVLAGSVSVQDVVTVALEHRRVDALVKRIRLFCGVDTVEVPRVRFGDICEILLQEPIGQKVPLCIGGTIGQLGAVELVPYKKPDDPTYSLVMRPTEAKWKGKEARDEMSRLAALQNRLQREEMVNTALQLDMTSEPSQITLKGRGPLHLSVIVEDMRRDGYEFEICAPRVLTRVVDGVECEPFERLSLECKESLTAELVSFLSARMAEIDEIEQLSGSRVNLSCVLPVRLMSTVPLRFHTLTGGDGVLHHQFDSYRPLAASEVGRETGALISTESGTVTEWSLTGFAQQGRFFVLPGDVVHYGQIIGENTKTALQNLGINVCKRNEQLGGMRANATDKASSRRGAYSAQAFSFEDCVAWVVEDELVTVTPKSIRMRKPNFNGKTTMRSLKK